jgi:hypothetical protein
MGRAYDEVALSAGWRQRAVAQLRRARVVGVVPIARGRLGSEVEARRLDEKGAALSVVLAPGGMAMFWVTQAAWARAGGMSHAVDINAPARTTNMLFIFILGSSLWKLCRGADGGQGAAALEGGAHRCSAFLPLEISQCCGCIAVGLDGFKGEYGYCCVRSRRCVKHLRCRRLSQEWTRDFTVMD